MPIVSVHQIDKVRKEVSQSLNPIRKAEFGQFMTPSPIADFMASLFSSWPDTVRLLDPGAGIGSLTEAFSSQFFKRAEKGARLEITAFEIDVKLRQHLDAHLEKIRARGRLNGFKVSRVIFKHDFVGEAVFWAQFGRTQFTHAILNPPYRKIATNSETRRQLRRVGIETVNLYTAFLGVSITLTESGGEVVAIIPRSFFNGTYFLPFRRWLLDQVSIKQIHVFESRAKAFKDEDVLQENVILHLLRSRKQKKVILSSSHDATFDDYEKREVAFDEIVWPDDPQKFIRIPSIGQNATSSPFTHTLEQLDVEVATGPVVDFRLKPYWESDLTEEIVPLIYAHHLAGGFLWPKRHHKKPDAIRLCAETRKWTMPTGWYVLTKRFSAKEEKRRLVAYVFDPTKLPHDSYAFENHLNVFHIRKKGLPKDLAHGLALFLNSSAADHAFRNFSGHTQVNATDLRSMRYPSREQLLRFGRWARNQRELSQQGIDNYLSVGHGDK
jgi:adenine-specific DNA-methyltransferase